MVRDKQYNLAYDRAKRRVEKIKKFYKHLIVYCFVNALLLLFREKMSFFIVNPDFLEDSNFMEWVDWNVYGTPVIWGIVLVFHGLCVFFNLSLLKKNWEERQIQKYMQND